MSLEECPEPHSAKLGVLKLFKYMVGMLVNAVLFPVPPKFIYKAICDILVQKCLPFIRIFH